MPDPSAPEEVEAGSVTAGSADDIRITGNVINSTIIIKSVVSDRQVVDIESLPPEEGDPPYKGLQYFEEADAGSFFGREQLTIRLIGRLQRTRFLAIVGASGSGKSSVVRAGVIPALKSGAQLSDGSVPPPDSTHWCYRVFTPGGHPLDALAASLLPAGALPSQIGTLRDELMADSRALALAARSLLSHENNPHLLLVVDQLEEIFTLTRTDEEREAFVNALIAASSTEDEQPISVLVCLRADFYAQVAQHDRLRDMVSQYQEFIGAMSRPELVDAIVGPLVKNNWKIQKGLVQAILREIGFEPGSLPLLSHALLETWKLRRGRTLTLSGYEDCGGVEGAIRKTADSVFRDRLNPEQQAVARMIFLHLAELNEDAQDTRRRASFSELITRSTDERTIQTVINILADARLVTTSTLEPGDQKVVEVAHESLIREWPTLRDWLNQDRQGLILHRQLTEAAEDWLKNGRDAGLLMRGTRLKQVQAWSVTGANVEMLSLQEAEFLDASEAQAHAEAAKEARQRRMQFMLAGVSVVLLALVAYLIRPKPPVMNGPYNVAVADFSQILPDGIVGSITDGSGATLAQAAAEALDSALKDNPAILVWNNRPDLKVKGVQIGPLVSRVPGGQSQAAAALAQRLHADMLVYGILDRREQPPVLVVNMYLAPKLSDTLGEVQGNFQVNTPIPVTSDLQASDIRAKVVQQSGVLALLVLAQSEERLGHTLEALEFYLKAAALAPDSDLLQFFIGREYLFTIERKPIPPAADPAFEQRALEALNKSLELNPHNSRAYVGLAAAYVKQAQPLIDRASSNSLPLSDADFARATGLLDQAQAAYERVLQPGFDTAQYGVPMADIARLGLGNVWLLRGVALQAHGQTEQAGMAFQEAIQGLEKVLPAFQSPELSRYLAQNRQFLGNAYQWSGYRSDVVGNYPVAIQAYEQATLQFKECISLGDTSEDRIIKSDIVEDNCKPMLEQTEQRLKLLKGG